MQFDNAEKRHFIGLPIPAAAEVIATTVLLYYRFGGEGETHKHAILLLVTYALAALMVSNLKFFSFKETELYRRQPFWILLAVIVLLEADHRRAADHALHGRSRCTPARDRCAGWSCAASGCARRCAGAPRGPARWRHPATRRRCPARARCRSTAVDAAPTALLTRLAASFTRCTIMIASRNALGASLLLELLLLSPPGASGGA